MDQNRTRRTRPCCPQNRQKLGHVMPINRADIRKAKLFEQGPASAGHARDQLAGPSGPVTQRPGQSGFEPFGDVLECRQRRVTSVKPRQIGRHRADGRGDAHLVVIKDHEHPASLMAGIVHRFISHTSADRAIADHSNRIACRLVQITPHGKTKCCGNRRAGMGRTKRVVLTFRAFGKARKPALLTQGANAVASPGQDLVRIALMPDIPDQLVKGGVEDRVDCHAQLDHPQR